MVTSPLARIPRDKKGDRAGTGEGPWVVDGKGRVREEEEEGRDGG